MEEHGMARAVYPHEITDPDFQWLLNNYCESHPNAFKLDSGSLPVVIITGTEVQSDRSGAFQQEQVLPLPPEVAEDGDTTSPKK